MRHHFSGNGTEELNEQSTDERQILAGDLATATASA